MLNIRNQDFDIREVVYIKWREDSRLFECSGELIKLEDESLSIGFNFHLDNILDILTIKIEDILEITKKTI
jgi:hypothetical protein